MKIKLFFSIVAALVVALSLCPKQAHAKIWRVNNNLLYVEGKTPGQPCDHCFINLQDAINSSNVRPGDTLHVEGSATPYGSGVQQNGTITINKPLVILGPGYFLHENLGLQQNQLPATTRHLKLVEGSAGAIIKGLSINADVNNAYLEIANVDKNISIERCNINRVVFSNTLNTGINNISIRQSFIHNGLEHAFQSPNPVNNLVISNNYFGGRFFLGSNYQGTVAQNVFNAENNTIRIFGGMVYYNNIIKSGTFTQNNNSPTNVYKNIFNVLPTWLTGSDNISMSMSLVFGQGTTDGQYDPLDSCAPCKNGQNSHEIGMFGGPAPYRLSGPPDIPSIVLLRGDTDVVQGGKLPITIKTRTNH